MRGDPDPLPQRENRAGGWISIIVAAAVTLPGLALELGLYHASTPVEAAIFGVAIVGAAFLLSWASEVLQLDVSRGLALALLALIAVLPEYIVDATFAWLAARDPAYAHYAVANMTGANRVLIGLAWPLVIFIAWLRTRQHAVSLHPGHGLELVVLLVATLYAFVIPFKGTLSLIDLVVLGGLFVFYMWRLARLPADEPHLVGPAEVIAGLPAWLRRTVTIGLGLAAATVILMVAEPFARALVEAGAALGIDEFFLVQWLAPLASEAPEFVVVSLFAWRGASGAAFGVLVSSKVNQWTLLVATLPLVYTIALGRPEPLPLDGRQQAEVFLTAAQSLCAVLLMLDLRLSVLGASLLFGLFAVQFVLPEIRMEIGVIYLVLGLVAVVVSRKAVGRAFRGTRFVPPSQR